MKTCSYFVNARGIKIYSSLLALIQSNMNLDEIGLPIISCGVGSFSLHDIEADDLIINTFLELSF